MNYGYNKLIIYEFKIEAVSSIYFGASNKGELIKDSKNNPILFGNSIGGALRNYLEESEVSQDIIYKYLGGNQNEKFLESIIYISDGEINPTDKIHTKEGTRINHTSGSAEKNHKYTIEYLSKGSTIIFKVECEVEDKCSEEIFNKIIGTLQKGFKNERIKLGGQQNNGFGEFKLNELRRMEHTFNTQNDLDEYIFSSNEMDSKLVEEGLPSYENKGKNQINFSLKGKFPYGIYQGFRYDKNGQLTGLQKLEDKYYLPATSFKGLVKNEIRILLSKFLQNESNISKKLDEIFGDQKSKGKILFSDIVLENSGIIKTKRFNKDSGEKISEESIYIKVDRLTGDTIDGAMRKQVEVYGNATLECKLMDCDQDENPYIFPLIYVFKRIGEGIVPLGGRTSIGLGQFYGTKLKLSESIKDTFIINELSSEQIEKIKEYYNFFESWCRQ
ncbi:hypothetical protein GOQ29_01820 [Clostridium sp. D2Q-14]|uniref:RAMP superfamily CRISPR-associated protein n=1 Tax=Anaeromonas gelatinilytica TaxID=2683194 RepID=UPI00193C67C6|nr:RAMP superfamily CRISPR-associated protein [Anaeromonas gelatinilytica]MBS4534351.1 hypothetical protein [Anaeromonas gelatinilytica]